MCILVTGGAGFIGSHSVEALLARGYRVRVLDNLTAGRKENLPADDNLELVVGDIRDIDAVKSAMGGAHSCLHLAAQVSVARSIESPQESASDNILGFVNVLEAARHAGTRRLVYASSAAVYGHPEQLPIAETATPAPISPYGLEKLVDEYYAGIYARLHKINSLGFRYFNVYGPRQDPKSSYAGVISKFVEALQAGRAPQFFGDGSQTRDFVFVKDIAEANCRALESSVTGVMNVARNHSVDLLQLSAELQRVVDCRLQPVQLAEREGDIRHSRGNADALEHALGFRPQWSLAEGLEALVASVDGTAGPTGEY